MRELSTPPARMIGIPSHQGATKKTDDVETQTEERQKGNHGASVEKKGKKEACNSFSR